MKRLMFFSAVAGFSISVMAPHAQQPVFRSTADAEAVDVAVTESKRPVATLSLADFTIRDNGVAQTIAGFSYGSLPIDVHLFVDVSGSITPDQLARYDAATRQLERALIGDDRYEVSTFAKRISQIVTLQPPPITVTFRRPELDGTSFYDAALLAMMTLATPGRRTLTLLLTDGVDSNSFFDEAALGDAAKRSDSTVYALVAVDEKMPLQLQQRLQRVTSPTGGQLMTIARGADIGASLARAIGEFRQSYVLTYVPAGVPRDGWHTITVTTSKGKSHQVRARQGYFGG